MSRRLRCGPSGGSSRSAWKPAVPAWRMHMAKSSILSCRTRQEWPTSSIVSCRRHLNSMPRPLVDAYDFSRFQTIADVGGGQGRTLAAILTANPGVSSILFDRREVLAGRCVIDDQALIHRAKKVSGDMHVELPHGADCYLVKWVLADRDDARAIEVLRITAGRHPGGLCAVGCGIARGTDR